MSPTSPEPSQPRPRMAVVFTTVLLELTGFAMILPLLPFYAEDLGASAFQIGVLFSAYSLAQLLLAPAWGRLSDRLGRRPVLLTTIVGHAGGHLLFAAAGGYGALLVARLATGASATAFTLSQAVVADVTPPARRSRGLGILGAAFGLGFTIGPALGGILGQWGEVLVPLGAAALSGVNFLVVLILLPESLRAPAPSADSAPERPPAAPTLRARLRGPTAGLLGLFFLVIFAFSTMEATLALFCAARHGFGVVEMAWLFAFVGLLVATVQGLLLGRLVSRFGERRLIPGGILLMASGLLLVPLAPTVPVLVAAVSLLAVGTGLHSPSLIGMVSQLTPAERQGGVLGLSRSVGAFARVVGPLWGGWIFQTAGPDWPYWVSGTMMALTLVLALVLVRRAVRPPAIRTEPC